MIIYNYHKLSSFSKCNFSTRTNSSQTPILCWLSSAFVFNQSWFWFIELLKPGQCLVLLSNCLNQQRTSYYLEVANMNLMGCKLKQVLTNSSSQGATVANIAKILREKLQKINKEVIKKVEREVSISNVILLIISLSL